MKTILKKVSVLFVLFTILSCSSDDDNNSNGGGGGSSDCFAGSMQLSNQQVTDNPEAGSIRIDFDIKNTSSKNYSYAEVFGQKKAVYTLVKVKTTDGAITETKLVMLATSISAGATAVTSTVANYSKGKTYESYTLELYCQ
jgi:hypothetical protein